MTEQYIIMCRSLTFAQRAAVVLERAGITAATARAPQELTKGGCGYCIKVSERRYNDALKALDKARIPYGRVFCKETESGYIEVTI